MYDHVKKTLQTKEDGEGQEKIKSQVGACKGQSQTLLWDQKDSTDCIFEIKLKKQQQELTIDNRAALFYYYLGQIPNWLMSAWNKSCKDK